MAGAPRGQLRGKLIVLEGLDRAGKSTQCAKLVENLRNAGHEVKQLRFPSRCRLIYSARNFAVCCTAEAEITDRSTPIGTMIDAYLKGQSTQEDHVIHLLFSANRWEAAAEITTAINAGVDVVIDRYYYSGCVYSAAKNNPSLDLRWARKPDEGLPAPDICVFLDISAQDAAKRGAYGQERYEKQEMQNRVRQLFLEMKNQATKEENFQVVDGGQSLDAVEKQIWDLVNSAADLKNLHKQPLASVKPW